MKNYKITGAQMHLTTKAGRYQLRVNFVYDGQNHTATEVINSSPLWDEYTDVPGSEKENWLINELSHTIEKMITNKIEKIENPVL